MTIVSGPPCAIVWPCVRVELFNRVAVEVTSEREALEDPEAVAVKVVVRKLAEAVLVLAVPLPLLLLLLLPVEIAWRCKM
jgi:hypothetical protein